MDFGVLGLDQGLGVSLSSSSSSSSSFSEAGFVSHISSSNSDPETKHRTLYGSGFCNKQERSEGTVLDDFWRSSKLSKTSSDADFLNSKAMFQRKNTNFPRSTNSSATLSFLDNTTDHHQMLSFSSPKPAESFLVDHKSSQIPTSPNYFLNALSTYNCRSIAGFNSGCLVNGGNYDMHGMKAGPFTPSQWIELEQQALIYKYITANIPIPSNLLTPIRKAFDSVAFSSFPPGLLRPNTALGWGAFHLGFSNNTDPEPGRCRRTDGKKWRCSRDAVADQKYCERHINRGRHRSRKPVEGQTGHSLAGARNAAATTTTTTSASSFSIALPRGGVASNAPGPASNSSSASTNMNRSNQFGLVDSETQNTLRHFIDIDWPDKTAKESNNNNVSQWPESDRTKLSISISSMPSSDANLEQNTASHVDNHHHHHQRQALNLIPMSWETSLGGPLGEVLHHTNNNNNNNNNNNADSGDCKRPFSSSSSSVLNLMTEGWDSSPPMGSSPTGVLQKTAFGSLSNSSAGSSPRAGNFNKDLPT